MPDREPRASEPRDIGWFLAIGLVGTAVRLAFAWQYTRHPLGQFPWVDEASYWSWARSLREFGWLPLRPFYQDPLYPYGLALLMGLVGDDVTTLRLVSAGLGCITPLVVAWVGRRALGRAEGLIAGGLLALYGPLVLADGSLEKEGLSALGASVALGLTAWWASGSVRPALRGASAGMAWGLLGLLRSNAMIIAPIGAVWWIATAGRGAGVRRRLVPALAFLAGFVSALTPAVVANMAVSRPREFIGTTWQAGPNFYIGNGPEATGTYAAPPFVRGNPAYEAGDYAAEASRRSGRSLSPGEVSRFWLDAGLRRWLDAPGGSARLLVRKLGMVLNREEIPDNVDFDFLRVAAAPTLGLGVVGFGVLLPLAALGLGRAPRPRFWWFLIISTASGLATTALFFVVGRYRLPWVPGLALLAGAGCVDLVRLCGRRAWRGLAWRIGLLAVPAALLAWRPQDDPAPGRWENDLIALGLANLRAGRIDPAIDAFDDARALGPSTAARIESLCGAEPVRGGLAAAIPPEGEADRDPEATLLHARRLRQLPEGVRPALSRLRPALVADPTDPGLNREWGFAQLSRPSIAAARREALSALGRAAKAGDPASAVGLALASAGLAQLDAPSLPRSGDVAVRVAIARLIISRRTPPSQPGPR